MDIAALDALTTKIAAALPDATVTSAYGEVNAVVPANGIVSRLMMLRDNADLRFTTLIDITGVDYPDRGKRFDVVYHLLSMTKNARLRVKTEIGEGEAIESVVSVYPAANWFEREAFDMYGILFANHPDLRRILTDYGFSGHPLRKDFPLTGYVELRYDDEQKRVVYSPVKLQQEFRSFDYLSPWEGARAVPLPGDEKAKP